MLQQAVRFIKRISSAPTLLALMLVSALFPALFFPLHEIGNIKVLDLYFSYSPDQVYAYLTDLGEDGRRAYTSMALCSDLIFPVIYALALSIALMQVLIKRVPANSQLLSLCLFPFLIVIADWCENLSLAFVTRTFPESADRVVTAASFFTSLKWTLVVLTVLVLLIALAIQIINNIRSK